MIGKETCSGSEMKGQTWIMLLGIINIYQERCKAQNCQTEKDERLRGQEDKKGEKFLRVVLLPSLTYSIHPLPPLSAAVTVLGLLLSPVGFALVMKSKTPGSESTLYLV